MYGYLERHYKAMGHLTEFEELKRERQSKSLMLGDFIKNIDSQKEVLEEFDDRFWMAAIDSVTIHQDGMLCFKFKDGTETCR
jgi:site-specific DNA recombinase